MSTLDEIAARTGASRFRLADVLAEEVEAGRVSVDGAGCYELVADRFDPDVLAALADLAPPDDDFSRVATTVRISAPATGELAKAFA